MDNEPKLEQFILNLASEQSFDVEEYIILPANQSVVDQLLGDEMLASSMNSPLTILFGGKSTGKTHLSHLWQHNNHAIYLSDEFLKVPENSLPKLADVISNSAIIIDDIDLKIKCEKTLFHIINLALQAKQKILLTSSKPLLQWNIKLPDLVSRLKAAKHIEISSPDDMLIEAMLIKSFAEKQLNVADNVVAYILPRIDRSIDAVITLVNALDKHALQHRKSITRTMVAKMLENNIE